MGVTSNFTATYTTHAGCDITAIFDNLQLATLTGVAVSVTREKAPVYTFGSANPRSISRGKRGVAGSLMFTLFDRDAFHSLFIDEDHWYYAHLDEVNWLTNPLNVAAYRGLYFDEGDVTGGGASPITDSLGTTGVQNATGPGGAPTSNRQAQPSNNDPTQGGATGGTVGARTVKKAATYADQVFPFDITLVAQNEYGNASYSSINGVEIINEGGGVSMDDITNEQQMTYIAITRQPWVSLTDTVGRGESFFGRLQDPSPGSVDITQPEGFAPIGV